VPQYITTKIDPDSGQTEPPFTSTTPPINLQNGDKVVVTIISSNPEYRLSNTLSATITVTGLQQVIQKPEPPVFLFTGEDGSGVASISNGAPQGFK